jgi:hypothetical protein
MQRELRAVDVTLPVITAQTMAQDLERSQAAPKVVATVSVSSAASLWCWRASVSMRSSRSRGGRARSAFGWRSAPGVSRWSGASTEGWRGVRRRTSIGLVLTVLIVLALRATPGSADIGIGSMDVYRPNIDPVALVAIAAVTAVVGVAAAFVPARRAVRMDPLMALRHE